MRRVGFNFADEQFAEKWIVGRNGKNDPRVNG